MDERRGLILISFQSVSLSRSFSCAAADICSLPRLHPQNGERLAGQLSLKRSKWPKTAHFDESGEGIRRAEGDRSTPSAPACSSPPDRRTPLSERRSTLRQRLRSRLRCSGPATTRCPPR